MKKEDIETKSPQETWADCVKQFFSQDDEVNVNWNNKTNTLLFTIDRNVIKRLALKEIFGDTKMFGKVEVKLVYVDADRRGGKEFMPEVISAALQGNPYFKYLHVWDEKSISNPHCWLEFDKQVIQYPEDSLHSLYMERSCLPAELAKDVFGAYTKYMCYDTIDPDKEAKPTDQKGNPIKD